MVVDSFYTSTLLARDLVSHINHQQINAVADFCVGGGELLRVATTKWPDANYFGLDISIDAITELEKSQPDWSLIQCDFMDPISRHIAIAENRFDLILLNPPFSCKGSTIKKVSFDGFDFNVSTAMAFLLESLKYLSNDGLMYAILPISIAYSDKDSVAFDYLYSNYHLSVLEERDKQPFSKCSPSIIIISLNDKKQKQHRPSLIHKRWTRPNGINIVMYIQRGNLSICDLNQFRGKLPLVHTTNLIDNQIKNISHFASKKQSIVNGPAILIPRVCNPNKTKICTIRTGESYVISDCIIAIGIKDDTNALNLKNSIIDNWNSFRQLYQGTGAKYITIRRLKKVFKID